MFSKMQNLENRIENKLQEIDKMFVVQQPDEIQENSKLEQSAQNQDDLQMKEQEPQAPNPNRLELTKKYEQ